MSKLFVALLTLAGSVLIVPSALVHTQETLTAKADHPDHIMLAPGGGEWKRRATRS